jgi:hypothetical protein
MAVWAVPVEAFNRDLGSAGPMKPVAAFLRSCVSGYEESLSLDRSRSL